jgi:excisionase family DNA binding protein
MKVRETFVTVHEAASVLGVAMNTVRAWGAAGKIPEYRHPMNGYRLYKRKDLQKILRQLEVPVPPKAAKHRTRPR